MNAIANISSDELVKQAEKLLKAAEDVKKERKISSNKRGGGTDPASCC